MSRFLFVYDPAGTYDKSRILVLDRGPAKGTQPLRGDHLRERAQAAVLAECTDETTAKRIIAALEAAPGDEDSPDYEEPF